MSTQKGLTGRRLRRTQVGLQFLGIQPDITTLLNNLDAKKPDFDKAGLKILDVRSLIRDSVSIQQQGAKELGSSVSSTPFQDTPAPPAAVCCVLAR